MKIGADQVSIKIADHGSIAVEKDAGGKQEHHDEFDHDADVKTGFHISHGLTTEEAEELRKTWGLNELPEKVRLRIYYAICALFGGCMYNLACFEFRESDPCCAMTDCYIILSIVQCKSQKVPKWLIYLKGLWGPMPVMIW